MVGKMLKMAAGLILTKNDAELTFWRKEMARYQKWFNGELSPLYKTTSPRNDDKVPAPNQKDASILTWHKLHQEVKYLDDLELTSDAFKGTKILDIGSGPMPSATCFKNCHVYCLEPLLPAYMEIGFPIHYYENTTFINGSSEKIPIQDNFFDAVISVNAIDHVTDIYKTSEEIRRVLKENGLLRMHVHYHQKSVCEPIEFNDESFKKIFWWCVNLKKIKETRENHSSALHNNESFALWSNF